ncbi:golgi phosphoprotein 3, partial [Phenoliferia sp. Uapishka_3]
MSTAGLSRRRGGASQVGTNGASGGAGPSTSSPTTSTPGNPTSSRSNTPLPPTAQAPPAHRVAYDERDMETGEERVMPKLTLMEEVLLLGLKDKQNSLSDIELPWCETQIVGDSHSQIGEVLLDEALKMMKVSEKMSVGTWIDLMSGETWNVMKIGYQLKQVRERLAKGLVDKGVLRTEKRNFLLFDMATHPVSDPTFKDDVLQRTLSLLTSRTAAIPASSLYSENVRYRTIRAVSMVCAAFAANVLENALVHLGYDAREAAFAKCDELLAEFSQWPFGAVAAPARGGGIGVGSAAGEREGANLAEIGRRARAEILGEGNGEEKRDEQSMRELHLEIVAAALEIFRR